MTTESDFIRQAAIVERAQQIINALLMTMTTREALIELAGDEATAEFLADEMYGDYGDALEKAALAKAEMEVNL